MNIFSMRNTFSLFTAFIIKPGICWMYCYNDSYSYNFKTVNIMRKIWDILTGKHRKQPIRNATGKETSWIRKTYKNTRTNTKAISTRFKVNGQTYTVNQISVFSFLSQCYHFDTDKNVLTSCYCEHTYWNLHT